MARKVCFREHDLASFATVGGLSYVELVDAVQSLGYVCVDVWDDADLAFVHCDDGQLEIKRREWTQSGRGPRIIVRVSKGERSAAEVAPHQKWPRTGDGCSEQHAYVLQVRNHRALETSVDALKAVFSVDATCAEAVSCELLDGLPAELRKVFRVRRWPENLVAVYLVTAAVVANPEIADELLAQDVVVKALAEAGRECKGLDVQKLVGYSDAAGRALGMNDGASHNKGVEAIRSDASAVKDGLRAVLQQYAKRMELGDSS